MPMWAHYANNHQGFCIRYKIEECNGINKGDKIFPVLYTDSRIEGHSIVSAWLNEILYANKNKLPQKESSLKYISYMYLVNCAKHSSWEY